MEGQQVDIKMTTEQLYHNLVEVMAKMPNTLQDSIERYNRSALFNAALTSIAKGNDPYKVISDLINIIETIQDEYRTYVQKQSPMVAEIRSGAINVKNEMIVKGFTEI